MWKSFHLCIPSNHTKPSSQSSNDPNRPSILLINNSINLLHHDSATATTSSSTSTSTTINSSSSTTSYDESNNYEYSQPLDLTDVLASSRFFFSSPGRSNSITDSPNINLRDNYDTATQKTTNNKLPIGSESKLNTLLPLFIGGAAVKTHVQSPDPYKDFRRSMQEMLDAVTNAGGDQLRRNEFLHELLHSYLSLNDVDMHELIIKAYVDILVSLLSESHRNI